MATASKTKEMVDGMVCTLLYLTLLNIHFFNFVRGRGGQIKLYYINDNWVNTCSFGIMTYDVFTPTMTPIDLKS